MQQKPPEKLAIIDIVNPLSKLQLPKMREPKGFANGLSIWYIYIWPPVSYNRANDSGTAGGRMGRIVGAVLRLRFPGWVPIVIFIERGFST